MNYRMKKHFPNSPKLLFVLASITVTLFLFACGGGGGSGGGSGASETNTPPTANDGAITTNEDQATTGSLSASDADGDTLTFSVVTNGSKGNCNITDLDSENYILLEAVLIGTAQGHRNK